MNKNNILLLGAMLVLGSLACKKQLNVGNPNAPTLAANVNTEGGIISLATGAVYTNGFQNQNAYNWLGQSYFSLPYGYAELMGDMIGADAANELISQVSVPSYVILDNGTQFPATPNPPQITTLRTNNTRSQTGAGYNAMYYQWSNMYALNAACNTVLQLVGKIPFTGDTAAKANTIRAWCWFWKGYAYASIGSMYYSGLIISTASGINTSEGTSNKYIIKDSIILASNACFNQAAAILGSIPAGSPDYASVLGAIIPSFCQVGNGGVLTPTMWVHNINTMLARNILVNKLAPFVNSNMNATIKGASCGTMASGDWQNVLTLATNGIQKGDLVFTGRSNSVNTFLNASNGTVAAMTTGPNASTTFKVSERFTQDFTAGDMRLTNDFTNAASYLNDFFGTRYSLVDGGNGAANVYVYGNKSVGAYECFMEGSYEENALMLAEANIRLGNIATGLGFVDAVRAYQGAGVPTVAGQGLTAVQAYQQLVMERRAALFGRGLSFYDARRWGWTYDISNGGGSYGNIYLPTSGPLNTHTTFDYNFLDYWDVPADETVLNPPATGSAPVVNPNM